MKKKKVLVIVAHPDDETIWMGGTLLRNKDNWDITILSLCRSEDSDRAPKFFKVVKEYGAKGFMSDLDDEIMNPLDFIEYKKRIIEVVSGDYDEVYTHGKNGEYGHLRHIETSAAVKRLVKENLLKSRELFCFAYSRRNSPQTDTGFDSFADSSRDKFIKLNAHELLKKKNLIENFYGFKKNSFEERNCRGNESFKRVI